MAIINPIYGEMRGSLAGWTFSRNRGGQYVRLRAAPTNPDSDAQLARRTVMNLVSRAWSALLSDSDRQAWTQYAEDNQVPTVFGGWRTLTGHQMFCGVNFRNVMVGGTISPSPPVNQAPTPISCNAEADSVSSELTITFGPAPLPSNTRAICWWTLWRSPGSNPNRRQARILAWSAPAQTSPWTINLPYVPNSTARTNLYICTLSPEGLISTFDKVEGVEIV